jgi:hypothetical protein
MTILHLGERPLIVCDIDEVVLEFVSVLSMAYLDHNGHELRADVVSSSTAMSSIRTTAAETPERRR